MSRLLVAVTVCVGIVLVSSAAMGQKVGTGALLLDGIDDFVDVPDTLIGDTSYTIEAWILSTENAGWILGNNEDSDLRHVVMPGGLNGPLGSALLLQAQYQENSWSTGDNPPLNDGVWHHVAGVYDRTDATGGFVTMYIDGVDHTFEGVIWGTPHENPNAVPGPATLGFQAIGNMTDAATSYYEGMIDELVILDIALDAAGVAAHYNGGAGVSMTAAEPGLVAGWHFDVGSTTPDFSGNGYDGELMNGASIIPEPTTLALLGLGGLAVLRRRRRR